MSERPPLVLIPQFFGSLVFDRRTSRYLPFDQDATAVLTRLADLPFRHLLTEEADDDRFERLVRFYEHFHELGFFTVDGHFAGTVLSDLDVPADHLAGPLAVHLEVVSSCNLTCTHCFAGDLPRREKRLSLAEIDRIFAEMARLGSFRLGLTGGEPLLRKDIFRIIDLALEHGLAPCVTTNGLLINEEIAREFADQHVMRADETLAGLLRAFEARNAESLRLVETADLDAAVPVPQDIPWFSKNQKAWSVRWVILHVINELARHAGHADIIRETIDGATMYELIAGLENWEPRPWVTPWRPR